MLLDCILWFGLATMAVVFILMGCRLVIDFPGLLEGNVVQVFKESKDYKDEPFEGVSFKDGNRYQAIKSVKLGHSDHQLKENGISRQYSKPVCQAVPRKMAIQLNGCENEVKIIIHQVKQMDFSVQIDISSGDNLADSDKQVRHIVYDPANTREASPVIVIETGDLDLAMDDEPVREEVPVECDSYQTKDISDRQS
jgi:hypothetical protein